jgi:hypothetical protein|tara:strand:- start:2090 stop:2272 length:183 start_codon:yes stop_codon:yes gene_type:complete
MSASELLKVMKLGRYEIVVNGDYLEVSPAFSVDDEMIELLTVHKSDLISLLKDEVNNVDF